MNGRFARISARLGSARRSSSSPSVRSLFRGRSRPLAVPTVREADKDLESSGEITAPKQEPRV